MPDDYALRLQQFGSSLAHLHIGELSSFLEFPGLASLARQIGLAVSFDCAWDDACLNRADIASLICQVDVFLPNDSEIERLLSRGVKHDCAPLTVVKQGRKGATVYASGRVLRVLAEHCEIVDTISAGDAFNAGFLSAWSNNGKPSATLPREWPAIAAVP